MCDVVKYSVLPAMVLAIGYWIAIRPRALRIASIVDFQYFAAGIVLSAVSAELLPQIFARHNPLWVILGFLGGMGVAHLATVAVEKHQPVNVRLLAMQLGVNACISGILIGAGFVAGVQQGRLLSLALIGRTAFVGLNTPHVAGVECSRNFAGRLAMFAACGGLVMWAVLNYAIVSQLPHRMLDAMLALGLSGVLYLTIRDCLLEIQDELQAGIRSRLFCLGFVLFLVLHMLAISPTDPELIS